MPMIIVGQGTISNVSPRGPRIASVTMHAALEDVSRKDAALEDVSRKDAKEIHKTQRSKT
jgi:hypothetical protein